VSFIGFVIVGVYLKLGFRILYMFIIKLLISVRFWSEIPVHISSILFALFYLLLSLCTFFIIFYVFFSATSVSTIIIILLFTYYISRFMRSVSEKGPHCQPSLTFFCKEITDFKLRPEPISETACVLHTYTKACVQQNQKELKPLFVSSRLPLNTGTSRFKNFVGSKSEVKKILAVYKLLHLTVTEY